VEKAQGEELMRAVREGQPAAIIVNTRSRRGEALLRRAQSGLQQRGIRIGEAYAIREPSVIREAVRAIVSREYPLVVVAGGDGTVTSIVGELAYRDVILGLIPSGTGNSFARTVGIPLSLEDTLDVIANGRVANVDLGKVDGTYFANVTTIGLSVAAARFTPSLLKRYLGSVAYVLTGIYRLFSHNAFLCRLEIDGEPHVFQTHELIIANGRYFGKTLLVSDASVTNQQLVICSMAPLDRWKLGTLFITLLRQREATLSGLEFLTGHQIRVETEPSQRLSLDGEIHGETPATFSIAPGALKIMVPGEA